MEFCSVFIYFALQSTFKMNIQSDYKKDLSDIREMMEHSSRFISLSGLSGIFAGIYALAGAWIAYSLIENKYVLYDGKLMGDISFDLVAYLGLDALIVLLLALATGIYFTTRKARKKGLRIWDKTTKRLLVNLSIPLVTGGFFCIVLLLRGVSGLVVPATLIFYGLALLNASKYTLNDVRYLGLTEIILGLVACFVEGYGLIVWAIGFGVMHILYGTIMYLKYEK